MSPAAGLFWFCYFSLVAQLASRSSGYLYSQTSACTSTQRYAWTPTSSNSRCKYQHQHQHRCRLQRPLQQRQMSALGFSTPRHRAPIAVQGTFNALPTPTGTSIGLDNDIDCNISWDRDVDAEPQKAQKTTTSTTNNADHPASQLTRTRSGTGSATVAVTVPKSRNVASLGITWSSPDSGLGTSWSRPHLRSEASSLSTRSYIDSLKVADLKRACAERGLPRNSTVKRFLPIQSGNKETLRDRLWKWTTDRSELDKVNITGDFLTRYFEAPTRLDEASRHHNLIHNRDESMHASASVPNSLAEWARTVDLNPLLQKRKEIHRQIREGRPAPDQKHKPQTPSTQKGLAGSGYLKSLARALRAPSSPYSSNIKVKELYAAAKQADQLGERMLAKDLLQTLLVVTPTDARVVRRLARMHTEEGDIEKAKETLKNALEGQKENPWLWHGLGQLERNHGVAQLAKDYFAKAINYDATFAPSYHALATMEHAQGNVANAMRIIKKGIEFCPSNHRLWHACGCFYRAAQMLDDADRCYRRALSLGPPTSHCFVYSALASLAYEQGHVDRARRWLVKAVEGNNGRYAHGWVALSQLEESENNIKKAQLLCTSAVAQYERGLLEMRSRLLNKNDSMNSTSVELTNQLLLNVPKYRSGDKFVHVYRNWARLEETYGSPEAVDRVYERACTAFPLDYKLLITWAQYHQKNMNHHKARELFRRARVAVGNRHSDPFRMSAEMEMSMSNFMGARGILRLGAKALLSHGQLTVNVSDADDGRGLPLLIHTWAICEWHLGNFDSAEALFAKALQLSARTHCAGGIRSYILYSIARFKHYRGELHLAQHCVGLIMKENIFPGGLAKVWALWAEIARDMNNSRLEEECLTKAALAGKCHGIEKALDDLFESRRGLEQLKSGSDNMLSKDPWSIKLFGVGSDDTASLFKNLKFPTKKPDKMMRIPGP